MTDGSTRLILTVRPSLIAAPFHRAFTRPVVEIDGAETPLKWGTTPLRVGVGEHRVSVYFRYKGQRRARLGEGHTEVTGAAPELRLRAQLGVRNTSHFRIVQD